METDDMTNRVLHMIEHPEGYSEEEVQEILKDDECRETYELLVLLDNAYTGEIDPDTEQALREFESSHNISRGWNWRKIAAIFIGVLIISGITYAAISISRHHSEIAQHKVVKTTHPSTLSKAQVVTSRPDTLSMEPKVFDNVELVQILREISQYYDVKVVYASNTNKHIRLHYRWEKQKSLQNVVDALNHFEKVNLTLNEDKLIVE